MHTTKFTTREMILEDSEIILKAGTPDDHLHKWSKGLYRKMPYRGRYPRWL